MDHATAVVIFQLHEVLKCMYKNQLDFTRFFYHSADNFWWLNSNTTPTINCVF